MRSRFTPASLRIDVDTDVAGDLEMLRGPAKYEPAVSRIVMHETLHLWQLGARPFLERMLIEERGELTRLDRAVIDSIDHRGTLTSDTEADFAERIGFGDRMADRVASFGGSWTFILSFLAVLVAWVVFNTVTILNAERFDPFPYILLNLVLSCIAAVQAPLIMMSQRRQEAKDRLRAENDYRVNLKAEVEIRQLHEKLDHLLIRQ